MPADDDLMSLIDRWAAQSLIQNDKPNVQEESKIKKRWRMKPLTGFSGKKFDCNDATPRRNNSKCALANSVKYGRVYVQKRLPEHFYPSLSTATESNVSPNAGVLNDVFCSYPGDLLPGIFRARNAFVCGFLHGVFRTSHALLHTTLRHSSSGRSGRGRNGGDFRVK